MPESGLTLTRDQLLLARSAAYEIFPDIDHDGKDFVTWKLPGDRYDITITPTQKFKE